MTKIEAIRGSVRKWALIAHGLGEDHGPTNCALCSLYFAAVETFNRYEESCHRCSVKKTTGVKFCAKTPYADWCNHMDECHGKDECEIRCPECRTLAQAELMFLQGILEEEKKRCSST